MPYTTPASFRKPGVKDVLSGNDSWPNSVAERALHSGRDDTWPPHAQGEHDPVAVSASGRGDERRSRAGAAFDSTIGLPLQSKAANQIGSTARIVQTFINSHAQSAAAQWAVATQANQRASVQCTYNIVHLGRNCQIGLPLRLQCSVT